MKILVVCQHYYPEQFRITDICERLAADGDDVTVLTGLPNYPIGRVPKEYKLGRKRREIINGVNVRRCVVVGRYGGTIKLALNYLSFMIFASIKALFIKKDFDLIYVYQLSPVLMALPGILMKKRRACIRVISIFTTDCCHTGTRWFGRPIKRVCRIEGLWFFIIRMTRKFITQISSCPESGFFLLLCMIPIPGMYICPMANGSTILITKNMRGR